MPLRNPVLRTSPWTGETHPLSAFNALNSTGPNIHWTEVLVRLDARCIDYPQNRRQNPAGKTTLGGMPSVNVVSEVGSH
jgi:hypothetical protein